MIDIQFEFCNNLHCEELVAKILNLKKEFKPIYFSFGENLKSKSDKIEFKERFGDFIKKHPSGFFMKGDEFHYNISNTKNSLVKKLEIGFSFAIQDFEYLLISICELNPYFGFACLTEERLARNKYFHEIDITKIESWVGRDIEKQIPGFYWMTIISDELLQKHSIPLSEIASVAMEFLKLNNGLNLFKFYKNPEDWRNTTKVADLCASLPGVFDISVVAPAVSGVKNLMHYSELIRQFE